MMSAFSDLLALSGPPVNALAIKAHTTSAAATPISGRLIIYGPSLRRDKENCAVAAGTSTGYRGAVPTWLDSRVAIDTGWLSFVPGRGDLSTIAAERIEAS